ncbi:fibronectin type III domain-containing protein [Halorussus halobius]|uniref:hypothetical protein n=1 Tax=Halorussus halobius TaxID=1710537 RepID=UPI00109220F5|nr:hypothetical protein [Halorussus halobius]
MPIQVQTNLPDEDPPQLGNGVEDEVAVNRETAVSNYGSVRIQIRETGESSWDSSATGFGEFIGSYDTLTMEFVGREDGEEYEIRARTETEHVTGSWTTPVSIVTEFPGATGLTITDTTGNSVTFEFTDNADNEAGVRVWRRDERNPLRDTGYTDWEIVTTLDPNPGTGLVEHTDTTVEQNHDYEYYVEPYTPYTSVDSSTVATTTDLDVPDEGWFIVLEDETGERATLNDNDLDTRSPTLQPEVSAVARWRVDLPRLDHLRDWLASEAYLYYNGSVWMRGPYTRYHPDGGRSDASAQLEGLGILDDLDRGGTSFDVQSEPGYEAVDRFGTEELDGWTVDVTPPAENIVDENFLVQDASSDSELETVFCEALSSDDIPSEVDNGLKPKQVCWTAEAEDQTLGGGGGTSIDEEMSDNSAVFFTDVGEYVEYEITPEYAIPAGELVVAVRTKPLASQGVVDVDCIVDDENLGNVTIGGAGTFWIETDPYPNEVSAGETLTVRLEVVGSGDAGYLIDVLAPHDARYADALTFDNSVDSNYALDGPELYAPITLEADPFSQEFNIALADLAVAMNDTSRGQRLQASNDGGSTWHPNDGTEQHTTSITADFAAAAVYGTEIRGRVTLDGYGSRDATTPKQGYQPQTLTDWELQITTNALRVIDDQTYTGSPFEILDSIADDSGLMFVPEYREDDRVIKAFAPGDETTDVDWTTVDADPVDTVEGYYNTITVLGPKDDDGERLSVTASSDAAIDERGEIEGPAEFRPDAETEAELISIARRLVAEGVAKDTVTGSVSIESQFVQPGYAFDVEAFTDLDADAGPFVLQDARFEWGEMKLDFEARTSLARSLRAIETEIRTTKRAL